MTPSKPALLVLAAAVSASLAACADGGSAEAHGTGAAGKPSLTLYSAQHENLTEDWVKAFEARTGIPVQVRYGKDSSMGNQLVEEGAKSPADVFLTENSPAMTTVQDAGLLADVPRSTLDQVEPSHVPSSGQWVGVAARSTVLVYNPAKVSEADLPTSVMDLADAKWAGAWGAAAGGADFQAIVSAVLDTQGEAKTAAWLEGLKKNAKVYQNNTATMKAVNAGQVPMGLIYHYYWYRDQALTKAGSANTRLHYFKNHDPGAFVSTSGGAVLKSSKHPEEAQQLLAFVTSTEGQEILAKGESLEYAVGKGVASAPALPPLTSLEAPRLDAATLDGAKVLDLMTRAGIL